jgi:ribosomal protein S18 acetylase RimI-like enzyme
VRGTGSAGGGADAILIREATTADVDGLPAELRVSAYTANEGALRFYRRHGFTPLDTTRTLDI